MATTTLGVRDQPYEIPSYSLTGDILGYLRCGLQYRYTRIGKMPPRSPVQLWFGHFIHGCMDEGFRRYKAAIDAGKPHAKAMQSVNPDEIITFIEERLLNQGIAAWEPWLKLLGYARARVALLELGPHLFP
nr:PD-(D/E)XK nuclease family protein [Methylotetracoccus sp.]